jgi:hypothetical protein
MSLRTARLIFVSAIPQDKIDLYVSGIATLKELVGTSAESALSCQSSTKEEIYKHVENLSVTLPLRLSMDI